MGSMLALEFVLSGALWFNIDDMIDIIIMFMLLLLTLYLLSITLSSLQEELRRN